MYVRRAFLLYSIFPLLRHPSTTSLNVSAIAGDQQTAFPTRPKSLWLCTLPAAVKACSHESSYYANMGTETAVEPFPTGTHARRGGRGSSWVGICVSGPSVVNLLGRDMVTKRKCLTRLLQKHFGGGSSPQATLLECPHLSYSSVVAEE